LTAEQAANTVAVSKKGGLRVLCADGPLHDLLRLVEEKCAASSEWEKP